MLGFQIVQRVVKSLVESALSHTVENTKREDRLRCIHHPVKQQVEGQSVGPHSVQNPRSPSSAQVKLEQENMVTSHRYKPPAAVLSVCAPPEVFEKCSVPDLYEQAGTQIIVGAAKIWCKHTE